jgi:spermidine synthase
MFDYKDIENFIISKVNKLPDIISDDVKIDSFSIDEKEYQRLQMMCQIGNSYQGHGSIEIGSYKRLFINGKLFMSNTPMEVITNINFIRNAHGNVLIAGLGLGLIIYAIQDLEHVTSITIIEKNKTLIDIMNEVSGFNKKVNIIHEDVFTCNFPKHIIFDTIYFDIWENKCGDNWTEIKKLKRKYKKHLADDIKYMTAWEEKYCRLQLKADNEFVRRCTRR